MKNEFLVLVRARDDGPIVQRAEFDNLIDADDFAVTKQREHFKADVLWQSEPRRNSLS